ncbi:flagellar export protein FliJ [Paenibacillaceae bacterium]|nr:flagellar export protein FliJ [Paenibacillaceae bacterium]
MTKYRYPYQKIVDLKKSEKTQAEWMLSTALGKLQQEERSLEQLTAEKAMWQSKLQASSAQIVSLSELRVVQDYLDYLEERISLKCHDVHHAKIDVEHQQVRLSTKMMDEKVWLKAKEKEQQKFTYSLMQKEQQELDEMATVRYMIPAQ